MSEPFVAELRLMAFNFAPRNWALCNGQLLPINQNQALFSLLGTTYGGNGVTNFALPDMRGRGSVHRGQSLTLGARAGTEAHALALSEMPTHVHAALASSKPGNQPTPGTLAAANNAYGPPADLTTLTPQTIANAGGGQAHENRQPFLTLNWCIALLGIFPSSN